MFLQILFLGMMFPTNPFSQLTSTNIQVSPPSSCFLDHEKDDLYINRSNTPNPILSSDDFTTSKQDLVEGLGLEQCDHEYNNLFWSEVKKEKVLKKDHHSKIHTPHGLRDRRVRLSIEVAKKFFYPQDLLGDDKASKTLEWLFSKSKVSIDELIKRRKESSSSSTITDRSEVVFMEAGELHDKRRKRKRGEGKKKKITRRCKSGYAVNQSRAEARARARERTKEKLQNKKLDNKSNKVPPDCYSPITQQLSFWSQIESREEINERNGESVMDPKIPMSSSVLYGYQHNIVVSNDLSSQIKHSGFLNSHSSTDTILCLPNWVMHDLN